MTATKERIWNAIAATSPEQRGYVLRRAVETNKVESFSDLLTDLEPFIEAEIQQGRVSETAEEEAVK